MPILPTSPICPKCRTKMFVNSNNLHCNKCGKRIYFNTECPNGCGKVYVNDENIHCDICGYRYYFDKMLSE